MSTGPSQNKRIPGNLVCSRGRGKHCLLLDVNVENEKLMSLQGWSVFENGSDREDVEPREKSEPGESA